MDRHTQRQIDKVKKSMKSTRKLLKMNKRCKYNQRQLLKNHSCKIKTQTKAKPVIRRNHNTHLLKVHIIKN